VIQDDAIVCANFAQAVEKVAEENAEHPVALFLGAYPQGTASKFRQALRRKEPYVWMHRSPIIPLVAVLWPRHKAQEFLHWTDENPRKITRADDGVAGWWARSTRQQVRVTVPCLVEHPDLVPSVKGGQQARWGKDRTRKAVYFIPNV
jgi:hypothetical protein